MIGGVDWLRLDLGLRSAQQIALVAEVQDACDRLGAPGLDRSAAAAGLWDEDELYIVLPLIGSPHASLQVRMNQSRILATWEDKHYVWDDTADGEEALRVDGVDEPARRRVIAWLVEQMRRPYRRRTYAAGPFEHVVWEHGDEEEDGWSDTEGILGSLLPSRRLVKEEGAGFTDPPR